MPTLFPKGFVPFHNIEGAKVVVLPGADGKRVEVAWAHAGPLADKVAKTGEHVVLGPRHEISLAAWSGTKETAVIPPPQAKKAVSATKKATPKATGPSKPASAPSANGAETPISRGRPRKDGLATGSYEAGVLAHAHETRTAVPQEVLDKMSPEARLVEEARNEKILHGGGIKRGRPTKSATVTNIADAKKAKAPAKKAAEAPSTKRRLIRRAAAK